MKIVVLAGEVVVEAHIEWRPEIMLRLHWVLLLPIGHHGGEELRLDAGTACGTDARLGPFGEFHPFGRRTPGALWHGHVETVILDLAVGQSAAHEGASRQPPMGDRAERQNALVTVIPVLERVVRDGLLRLALGFRLRDRCCTAEQQAGTKYGEADCRQRECASQGHSDKSDGIAADDQRRNLQHHVAEHATHAGRQRPSIGRCHAASYAGKQQRRTEPGERTLDLAVDIAGRKEKDTPHDRRNERGHRRQTIELHSKVRER